MSIASWFRISVNNLTELTSSEISEYQEKNINK